MIKKIEKETYLSLSKRQRIPKLPNLLDRKLYKIGQTRGADDDEIYQNRVLRNSTALIPFSQWEKYLGDSGEVPIFENGYIVLIDPAIYFSSVERLNGLHLELGTNLLLFYETREQWQSFPPQNYGYSCAISRTTPLGGQYIARIPATTAQLGNKIVEGFSSTSNKGAGIRAFEYAPSDIISLTKLQLEAIIWHCPDTLEVLESQGLCLADSKTRKEYILSNASTIGLLNYEALQSARILNANNVPICPFCLKELSCSGFFTKVQQAEGREVLDLTITELNLFHIKELRYGLFNHRPYNLGWGHHHCNVVVKDSGIMNTLTWIQSVIEANKESGYI